MVANARQSRTTSVLEEIASETPGQAKRRLVREMQKLFWGGFNFARAAAACDRNLTCDQMHVLSFSRRLALGDKRAFRDVVAEVRERIDRWLPEYDLLLGDDPELADRVAEVRAQKLAMGELRGPRKGDRGDGSQRGVAAEDRRIGRKGARGSRKTSGRRKPCSR